MMNWFGLKRGGDIKTVRFTSRSAKDAAGLAARTGALRTARIATPMI
jgi:hypothetical protein